MFEVFVAVIIEAAIPSIFGGYFRRAATGQIGRWKLAAWGWLAISMASFWLVSCLAMPFVAGLAIAAGLFATVASIVCSISASILHWQRIDPQIGYFL